MINGKCQFGIILIRYFLSPCRKDKPGNYVHQEAPSKAFTLIELLVVIGIIALLLGILLPALGNARVLANRAACRANLRSIAYAFRMYLDDNGDVMPPAAQMPSLGINNQPPIISFILSYVSGQNEVFRCPSDTGRKYFMSEGSSYEYNSSLGGETVGQSFLAKRFGESQVQVMYDYEPFHGKAGRPGATNYLYANSYVGDLKGP